MNYFLDLYNSLKTRNTLYHEAKTILWWYKPMLITAIFMIVKIWKQPKYQMTEGRIEEDIKYIYNVILLSYNKRRSLVFCYNLDRSNHD